MQARGVYNVLFEPIHLILNSFFLAFAPWTVLVLQGQLSSTQYYVRLIVLLVDLETEGVGTALGREMTPVGGMGMFTRD